jgi:DNA-binding beta-propeller fold protein YncE
MKQAVIIGSALALGALASGGCGAMSEDGAAGAADAGAGGVLECVSSNECPTGYRCSELGRCEPPPGGDDEPPPPEVEVDLSVPQSSLRYLYVAMPDLDALARIDGQTLEVASVQVGRRPRVVAAAPGSDTAIALDSENGTATIVRPTEGADDKTVVPTLPKLNAAAWDPTGRFAVAYFDLGKALREAGTGAPIADVGSFQDVTIVALGEGDEPDRAVDMTVGFRPRAAAFDAEGTHAYIITDDGISVIDLAAAAGGGGGRAAPILVTDDPFADPEDLEVQVLPHGAHALVRERGRAGVRVVALLGDEAGQSVLLPLSSEPTDLEIDPSGERAYAVLRETAELAVIELPAADESVDLLDPEDVQLVELDPERPVGSLVLASDGHRGLLFTNAEERRELTVIDLRDPEFGLQVFPLKKGVRAVGISPSGDQAIVLHSKQPGDPGEATSTDEMIARSYGYSVFDAESGFARLVITPVDPGPLAFASERPRAYVALDGGDAEGAVAEVHVIDLDSFVFRVQPLASPPEAVGVLGGADTIFVSQRHPLGRVSFFGPDGRVRTLTGFDLNGRIVD